MHNGTDGVFERPVGWFKKSLCVLLSLAIFNVLAIPLVQAQTLTRQQRTWHEASCPDPAGRYVGGLEQLEKTSPALHPPHCGPQANSRLPIPPSGSS